MSSHEEPKNRAEALACIRELNTWPQSPRSSSPQPCDPLLESAGNHEQLPLYTKSGSGFPEGIEELAVALRQKDSDSLPIRSYPRLTKDVERDRGNIQRQQRIVNMYFYAITKADVDILTTLSGYGLVTGETTNEAGKTPLLAAVEAGKVAAVRNLLDAGANINFYGITATTFANLNRPCTENELHTYRTPLQYAAQLGNLAIVKLLMELGADDSLIAPDGQLALRLAATNGHREVVAFLPRRRGGGYKRWKVKHTTAMRRCKKVVHSIYTFSKFFAWDVPRFFIWTVPKHVIVLPLIKSNKWLHEHGEEIPGMIVKGLREMRIGITKIPGAIWKAIKSIPRFIESVVKAIGRGLSACAKGIWKVIKSLPHAAKLTLVWIWTGVKNAGSAMANVFKSIISFIHTVCAAIFGFFRRITLQDVWQGLLACLRTVFVNVPKKIWEWLCKFGEASKQGLEALFGTLGKCMWYLVRIIWELIVYIPEKIGEILAACGSSLRSGGKEMLVWIDPKRV